MLRPPHSVAALLGLALAVAGFQAPARGQKSEEVVKVSATAGKPDASGKQEVVVVLAHTPGWHTYANPVGSDDLAPAQTTVAIGPKERVQDVKIDYPPGKTIQDKFFGEFKIWEDKVTIRATVARTKGDAGPLEVTVKFQACTDKKCLQGSTVKLTVP